MKIQYHLRQSIEKHLFKGKAIILFSVRQTGKLTLIEALLEELKQEWMYMNVDDADVRDILTNTTATKLKAIIRNKKILFIDEAQRVQKIRLTIKLVTDQIKDVQVLATGSSTFELSRYPTEQVMVRVVVSNFEAVGFRYRWL